MLSFGRRLQREITKRGWTQEEFAHRVGVTDSAINKIIRGKQSPRWKRAPEWAKALGLEGREAHDFIEAMHLAASPPSIRRLVARLRRSR